MSFLAGFYVGLIVAFTLSLIVGGRIYRGDRRKSRMRRMMVMICPNCNADFGARSIDGNGKETDFRPEDFILCSDCGEWRCVVSPTETRELTDEEKQGMSESPTVRKVMDAWRRARRIPGETKQ